MAMTEQEHREMMRKLDVRMGKRKTARKAYEDVIRRRLERGETVTEHAFGKTARYSLVHPGSFMPGQSASYLAHHIASRHFGFGTRVTFERHKRDPMRKKRHAAARIPKAERVATSREIRSLVAHGYSPAYAARKAYREHERDPKRKPKIMNWVRGWGPGDQKDVVEVYVYGPTRRADEGLVGHDMRVRPTRLGPGTYTMVVSPDTLEPIGGSRDPRKLTVAQRKKIPMRMFALPARRQLPLIDARHVRNAAARLAQMHKRGTITESEYKSAHARVRHAEKRLGIHPRPVRRHRGKK